MYSLSLVNDIFEPKMKEFCMQQGMEIGIEKGRTAVKLEMAQKLKSLNYPIADIAKTTGLTIEQIEKL